jgi:hypothetical protein
MTEEDLALIYNRLNLHYRFGKWSGIVLSVVAVILFVIGLLPDYFFWGWTAIALVSLSTGLFSFYLVKHLRPEPIMKVLTEHPESIKKVWVTQITQRINGIDANRREEVWAACADGKAIGIPTDVVWARLTGERDNPTTRQVYAAILSVAVNACAGPPPSPDGVLTVELPLTFHESIFGGDKLVRFRSIPRGSRCCARHAAEARATVAEQSFTITIPKLLQDGTVLHLPEAAGGKGEPLEDLYVHISVHPDPVFSRRELDIYVQVTISAGDALEGPELLVPTIYGVAPLRIPRGTQSGSEFRMPQRGIVHPKTGQRGDQFTTVRVV